MSKSPTSRSLLYCDQRGWLRDVVERWIPPGHRKDLFGFIDIVVIRPGWLGVLGVQATVDSAAMNRVGKIQSQCREHAMAWLAAGNNIEVWGWKKRPYTLQDGSRSRQLLWKVRRLGITLDPNKGGMQHCLVT